jgi:hypothetical protein
MSDIAALAAYGMASAVEAGINFGNGGSLRRLIARSSSHDKHARSTVAI